MKLFKELYDYRAMIYSLVLRELRGRYKGSVFGFAWTFLNPLLQLMVYTVVFSTIMRAGIKDYYLFLFVALIPWLFFSSSVAGGASCILVQKDLVKKIYFPRMVLPIAHVTGAFINMLLSFIVVFAVLLLSGKGVSLHALVYLPVIMIAEYAFALSMALLCSSTTVYFRDLEHILGIVIMAWQFLTPVMYSVDMVPPHLLKIFYLNPMTPIISAYRDILYYKQVPHLGTLLYGFGLSIALLTVGIVVFNKLQRNFAEEL